MASLWRPLLAETPRPHKHHSTGANTTEMSLLTYEQTHITTVNTASVDGFVQNKLKYL